MLLTGQDHISRQYINPLYAPHSHDNTTWLPISYRVQAMSIWSEMYCWQEYDSHAPEVLCLQTLNESIAQLEPVERELELVLEEIELIKKKRQSLQVDEEQESKAQDVPDHSGPPILSESRSNGTDIDTINHDNPSELSHEKYGAATCGPHFNDNSTDQESSGREKQVVQQRDDQ